MKFSSQYPILGIPIIFRTDTPAAAQLVHSTFSAWLDMDESLLVSRPPMEIEIHVRKNTFHTHRGRNWQYEIKPHRFSGVTENVLLKADRRKGYGKALVSESVIEDTALFRREVLECLALFLAARGDRVPIHASAVVTQNRAILFLGPSGSGKSTISYAACAKGGSLLSDDVVYISTAGGLRIWSNPSAFHLHASVQKYFPELEAYFPSVLSNGKTKLRIDIRNAPFQVRVRRSFQGEMVLCFLERVDSTSGSLQPLEPGRVREKIANEKTPGFNLDNRLDHVAEILSRQPAFRLPIGTDFSATIGNLPGI